MKGYCANIEQLALENTNFRRVLYTAKHVQLVVMSLKPSEDIGLEVHDMDQFFRIESGTGKAVIDGNEYTVQGGDVVVVPAGAKHNITNTSDKEDLKLYTLYCPPHHLDGTVHATKEDAEGDDEHFNAQTTEGTV